MVRLECSGIRFGSQLDEKHLFAWALEITGVVNWDQDTLVVRSRTISEASLRDLLAHFYRYGIPMKQLHVFLNPRNENWFNNPIMYWHKHVFGDEFSPSLETDAMRRSALR